MIRQEDHGFNFGATGSNAYMSLSARFRSLLGMWVAYIMFTVRTCGGNMIYATHIPKQERKRALRDVYAMEPLAPKFNPWSSCPITFDRRDHPTSIRHGGSAALVLDPIIDGFHLTRVLMDGGSSLNLLYQDTVHKMGIDPSRIKPTKTTFKGVIPGVGLILEGSMPILRIIS